MTLAAVAFLTVQSIGLRVPALLGNPTWAYYPRCDVYLCQIDTAAHINASAGMILTRICLEQFSADSP